MEIMKQSTETIHSSQHLRENRVLMLRAESFDGHAFVVNCVASFKESANEMKNYLLLLQGFRGTDKTISRIRSLASKAEDLGGFNFVAHHNMIVPCPTGFKGNFNDYALVLADSIQPILHELTVNIAAFSSELSQFISNKEVKISLRDNNAAIKAARHWRETATKATAPFFTSGSNQRQSLDKMFNSTAEITNAAKASLLAYERAYNADPREIESAVKVVTDKIDTLIEIATGDEEVEISKEALLNLAEKSYEIGRLVELVGVRCSECETAAVLMSDVVERVVALTK